MLRQTETPRKLNTVRKNLMLLLLNNLFSPRKMKIRLGAFSEEKKKGKNKALFHPAIRLGRGITSLILGNYQSTLIIEPQNSLAWKRSSRII